MKYKHPKDIFYNGTGWNAVNIRQFKNGDKKTEADFVKQCLDPNNAIKLTEAQAKELYAIANIPEETAEVPKTETAEVPKTDKAATIKK